MGSLSYSHDNSGLVTVKDLNGQSSSYGYDAIARLTSANAENYNYDPAGNNLANGSVYTSSSNELTANSDSSYSYDVAGNLSKCK